MRKRPDADMILTFFFWATIILAACVLISGVPAIITGESFPLAWIVAFLSLVVLAVFISIIIRIHNILLDIRDAVIDIRNVVMREQKESSVMDKHSDVTSVASEVQGADEFVKNNSSEELQAWKDSQILKAKAALEAGKITNEKYVSYVNKVVACNKIPEIKQTKS